MGKTKIFLLTVIIIILTSLSITINTESSGIGVSSTSIVLSDSLRAMTYFKTITIHNDYNENVTVILNATGEIKDWIIFNDYEDKTIVLENVVIQKKSKKKDYSKYNNT